MSIYKPAYFWTGSCLHDWLLPTLSELIKNTRLLIGLKIENPAVSLKIAWCTNSMQGSPAYGLLEKDIINSGHDFPSKMPDSITTLHVKMKIENYILTAYWTMTAEIKTLRNRIFICWRKTQNFVQSDVAWRWFKMNTS